MKKGIHPLKKMIHIIQTDGSFILSPFVATYYKKHCKLDVDTKKHPCWNPNKDRSVLDTNNRLLRFKHKYRL